MNAAMMTKRRRRLSGSRGSHCSWTNGRVRGMSWTLPSPQDLLSRYGRAVLKKLDDEIVNGDGSSSPGRP